MPAKLMRLVLPESTLKGVPFIVLPPITIRTVAVVEEDEDRPGSLHQSRLVG